MCIRDRRPHVHTQFKGKRNTVFIDNGEFGNKTTIPEKTAKAISTMIHNRKSCLKYIYENIQNCKAKEDFQPIINAIEKYM